MASEYASVGECIDNCLYASMPVNKTIQKHWPALMAFDGADVIAELGNKRVQDKRALKVLYCLVIKFINECSATGFSYKYLGQILKNNPHFPLTGPIKLHSCPALLEYIDGCKDDNSVSFLQLCALCGRPVDPKHSLALCKIFYEHYREEACVAATSRLLLNDPSFASALAPTIMRLLLRDCDATMTILNEMPQVVEEASVCESLWSTCTNETCSEDLRVKAVNVLKDNGRSIFVVEQTIRHYNRGMGIKAKTALLPRLPECLENDDAKMAIDKSTAIATLSQLVEQEKNAKFSYYLNVVRLMIDPACLAHSKTLNDAQLAAILSIPTQSDRDYVNDFVDSQDCRGCSSVLRTMAGKMAFDRKHLTFDNWTSILNQYPLLNHWLILRALRSDKAAQCLGDEDRQQLYKLCLCSPAMHSQYTSILGGGAKDPKQLAEIAKAFALLYSSKSSRVNKSLLCRIVVACCQCVEGLIECIPILAVPEYMEIIWSRLRNLAATTSTTTCNGLVGNIETLALLADRDLQRDFALRYHQAIIPSLLNRLQKALESGAVGEEVAMALIDYFCLASHEIERHDKSRKIKAFLWASFQDAFEQLACCIHTMVAAEIAANRRAMLYKLLYSIAKFAPFQQTAVAIALTEAVHEPPAAAVAPADANGQSPCSSRFVNVAEWLGCLDVVELDQATFSLALPALLQTIRRCEDTSPLHAKSVNMILRHKHLIREPIATIHFLFEHSNATRAVGELAGVCAADNTASLVKCLYSWLMVADYKKRSLAVHALGALLEAAAPATANQPSLFIWAAIAKEDSIKDAPQAYSTLASACSMDTASLEEWLDVIVRNCQHSHSATLALTNLYKNASAAQRTFIDEHVHTRMVSHYQELVSRSRPEIVTQRTASDDYTRAERVNCIQLYKSLAPHLPLQLQSEITLFMIESGWVDRAASVHSCALDTCIALVNCMIASVGGVQSAEMVGGDDATAAQALVDSLDLHLQSLLAQQGAAKDGTAGGGAHIQLYCIVLLATLASLLPATDPKRSHLLQTLSDTLLTSVSDEESMASIGESLSALLRDCPDAKIVDDLYEKFKSALAPPPTTLPLHQKKRSAVDYTKSMLAAAHGLAAIIKAKGAMFMYTKESLSLVLSLGCPQASIDAISLIASALGTQFEPFLPVILRNIVEMASDSKLDVGRLVAILVAECTSVMGARVMVALLVEYLREESSSSRHTPPLLLRSYIIAPADHGSKGPAAVNWRHKVAALEWITRLLSKQFSTNDNTVAPMTPPPTLLPMLLSLLRDSHHSVMLAAKKAISRMTINNPEISSISPIIIESLCSGSIEPSLDAIMALKISHLVDKTALLLISPLVWSALSNQSPTKNKMAACQILANMAIYLVDAALIVDLMLPQHRSRAADPNSGGGSGGSVIDGDSIIDRLLGILSDPVPLVRSSAAKVMAIIAHTQQRLDQQSAKKRSSSSPTIAQSILDHCRSTILDPACTSVDRSGVAQTMAEILAVQGLASIEAFISNLHQLLRGNGPCREGHVMVIGYLPAAIQSSHIYLGGSGDDDRMAQLYNCMYPILPSALALLADDNEAVRQAANIACMSIIVRFSHIDMSTIFDLLVGMLKDARWRCRMGSLSLLQEFLSQFSEGESDPSMGIFCLPTHGELMANGIGADRILVLQTLCLLNKHHPNNAIRHPSLVIWKSLCLHPQRTWLECMPVLMSLLPALALSDEQGAVVDGLFEDAMSKFGERIIIPLLAHIQQRLSLHPERNDGPLPTNAYAQSLIDEHPSEVSGQRRSPPSHQSIMIKIATTLAAHYPATHPSLTQLNQARCLDAFQSILSDALANPELAEQCTDLYASISEFIDKQQILVPLLDEIVESGDPVSLRAFSSLLPCDHKEILEICIPKLFLLATSADALEDGDERELILQNCNRFIHQVFVLVGVDAACYAIPTLKHFGLHLTDDSLRSILGSIDDTFESSLSQWLETLWSSIKHKKREEANSTNPKEDLALILRILQVYFSIQLTDRFIEIWPVRLWSVLPQSVAALCSLYCLEEGEVLVEGHLPKLASSAGEGICSAVSEDRDGAPVDASLINVLIKQVAIPLLVESSGLDACSGDHSPTIPLCKAIIALPNLSMALLTPLLGVLVRVATHDHSQEYLDCLLLSIKKHPSLIKAFLPQLARLFTNSITLLEEYEINVNVSIEALCAIIALSKRPETILREWISILMEPQNHGIEHVSAIITVMSLIAPDLVGEEDLLSIAEASLSCECVEIRKKAISWIESVAQSQTTNQDLKNQLNSLLSIS